MMSLQDELTARMEAALTKLHEGLTLGIVNDLATPDGPEKRAAALQALGKAIDLNGWGNQQAGTAINWGGFAPYQIWPSYPYPYQRTSPFCPHCNPTCPHGYPVNPYRITYYS